MKNGKDVEVLKTNLQPFFWRKVKTIIWQKKKEALQEFSLVESPVTKVKLLLQILQKLWKQRLKLFRIKSIPFRKK